jgi:hypothetical protein
VTTPTPHASATTEPAVIARHCLDCGTTELARHDFEECCAILKEQRNAALARAQAAEALQADADRERWAVVAGEAKLLAALQQAEAERDAARAELDEWREREAACCPEDVGFDEYVAALTKQRDAARAQLNAIAHAAWEEAYEAGQRGSLKRWLSSDVRHALAAAQPTPTEDTV